MLTALKITNHLSNLLSDENPKQRKQLNIDNIIWWCSHFWDFLRISHFSKKIVFCIWKFFTGTLYCGLGPKSAKTPKISSLKVTKNNTKIQEKVYLYISPSPIMISWKMNRLVFFIKKAVLFIQSKLVYEKLQMFSRIFWKIEDTQPNVLMYDRTFQKSGLMFVILKRLTKCFVVFTVYLIAYWY